MRYFGAVHASFANAREKKKKNASCTTSCILTLFHELEKKKFALGPRFV